MTVEEILRKLVSFNTIKDKQNSDINKYIKEYLEKYNFICEEIGNEKKILIARTKKEPKFCFFGHTDTVLKDKGNPFELNEKDGNLYGLGACDMKGGIAAMLKAISEIDFNNLEYGMMLVFTYDEETNFEGINEFVKSNIKYPEYLLLGEPTDNIPTNGSKGVLECHFDFYGKKAHSSRIEDSSNINCVNFFSELLKLEEYFKNYKCDDYEFKHSTMNIGIIKGGDSVNIVSDHTYATCDFRLIT